MFPCKGEIYLLSALVVVCPSISAGPPFQTDDPEPIGFQHYEFYTFASSDGTPVETDAVGPAVEFNWGALPNVHLHIIVPEAAIFLSNNPFLRRRERAPRFRTRRHRDRHQVPLCPGDQTPPDDWHVHDVRAARG
jgi:hypothetical protein